MPDANRTTDDQIIEWVDREKRILVSKDADFVDSHILRGRPAKLLVISTGNISNLELQRLLVPLIAAITCELSSHSFMEIGRSGIVIRG